jgi:hypothetical protein
MEDEYPLTETSLHIDNYIMYKIYPKNKELELCYIGHTTNFVERMKRHKFQAVNENGNQSHQKHYVAIRQNGGWDEWEMAEIEEFNGKTRLEARMREQELIEECNANLNTLNAYITEEKRKAIKKAITEKYREENKELIRQQEKKYKAEHKEIISEQMKKYREENKEKIYEKTKEYRENNKEKHQEWQKEWRENNKEQQKEKRKIYDAKKKEERLLAKQLTPVITEEEKEAIKKQKREQYNADRRLKRLQDKEQTNKA